MSQKEFVKPVGLETPYRLFNLGALPLLRANKATIWISCPLLGTARWIMTR